MSDDTRRPEWLRVRPLDPVILNRMTGMVHNLKLHTVCESARCPNRTECFANGTATFMILGDTCTRSCTFCAVKKGKPPAVDPQEPGRIVEGINKLGLRYAVITSVTRDDLPDGGAAHFARTINAIRQNRPDTPVEVLIPDFKGSLSALLAVIEASPTALNHNIETVPRLYPEVRPEANYQRSLELLKKAKRLDRRIITKSGLMLGLGETRKETIEVMSDLRNTGCDLITIGQYLQPSRGHHQIARYVTPAEFKELEKIGSRLGFLNVVSGPLVRSSFHAAETIGFTKPSKVDSTATKHSHFSHSHFSSR